MTHRLGFAFLFLLGCQGEAGSTADGPTDGAPSSSSSSGASGTPDSGAPNDAGGTSDGGDGGGPKGCPTRKPGTVVFVGDSITAGAGQPPYYRALLAANDDAKYPAWKGRDLATCGIAAANVVNVSKGGAVATIPTNNDPDDARVLYNQAKKIPRALAGPVIVIGTIGGNDGQLALVGQVRGTSTLAQSIARFTAGLGAALDELEAPNRFGAGVEASIILTNVYDPSDGSGVFDHAPSNAKCPSALGLWPASTPTTPFFTQLNTAMSAEVAKHPSVALLDLHARFAGHGVTKPQATNWFVSDCIHPDATGHDAVRDLFWNALP